MVYIFSGVRFFSLKFKLNLMDIQSFVSQVADGIVNLVYDKVSERLQKPIEDDLITPKKVQEMLDIDASTLFKWERQGYVKRVGSIGNKVYYSKSEIIKAIMENG